MEQTYLEKSCGNCAHFVRYYVCTHFRFRPIAFGACGAARKKQMLKKRTNLCERWEGAACDELERLRTRNYIANIARDLEHAVQYLDCGECEKNQDFAPSMIKDIE